MRNRPKWGLVGTLARTENIEDAIKELTALLIESDQVYQWDCWCYLSGFVGVYHNMESSRLQHEMLSHPLRSGLFAHLAKMIELQPKKIVLKLEGAKAEAFKKGIGQTWPVIVWDDPADAITATMFQVDKSSE